jgi:NAD-dependent dihydropyrimidine dehydrogenase PreA subunit
MQRLRYITDVATLKLDRDLCTGCRVCMNVCPHGVFSLAEDRKVTITDLDGCMECGACATNCAWQAITLKPGVGCAAAIINGWLHGTEPSCDGPGGCCVDVATAPAEAPTAQPVTDASSCCTPSSSSACDTRQDNPG